MRRLGAALIGAYAAALAAGAAAQDVASRIAPAPASAAQTAREIAPPTPALGALGKLNRAGAGLCSAILVSPRHALTAAHCLYFARTGRPIPPERLHFLPGYRRGGFLAHRRAVAAEPHPDYEAAAAAAGGAARAAREAFPVDIALITLNEPVADAPPMALLRALDPSAPVGAAFYSRARPELPTLRRDCGAHAAPGDLLFVACDAPVVRTSGVAPGASGGAVLSFGADGAPEGVAAIVVAVMTPSGVDGAGREIVIAARPPTEWIERISAANAASE